MSIAAKAAQAAENERLRQEQEAWARKSSLDAPVDDDWVKFEADAQTQLETILEGDPGPAMRLQPGTESFRAHAHPFPAELQRRRLLIYRVDNTYEVVAARKRVKSKGMWKVDFYVVNRSSNPMEEAMLAPFKTLAQFGQAIPS